MERLANVISYIFHPMWMPLITLTGVYYLDPFLGLHPVVFRLLLLILLINLIAPGVSILIMRYRNVISNLDITRKRERYLPFMMFIFYYGVSYFWLRVHGHDLHLPVAVFSVFSALLVALVLATLITLKTKISMHLLAMGSLCGVIAALNQMHVLQVGDLVSAGVIVSGMVGWARITLGVHTHQQVYFGFLLGFFVNFIFVANGLYL